MLWIITRGHCFASSLHPCTRAHNVYFLHPSGLLSIPGVLTEAAPRVHYITSTSPTSFIMASTTTRSRVSCGEFCSTLLREVYVSTDLLFQTKITWLLILGPVALVGDATGLLGEALCFTCSGLALIPCAER